MANSAITFYIISISIASGIQLVCGNHIFNLCCCIYLENWKWSWISGDESNSRNDGIGTVWHLWCGVMYLIRFLSRHSRKPSSFCVWLLLGVFHFVMNVVEYWSSRFPLESWDNRARAFPLELYMMNFSRKSLIRIPCLQREERLREPSDAVESAPCSCWIAHNWYTCVLFNDSVLHINDLW